MLSEASAIHSDAGVGDMAKEYKLAIAIITLALANVLYEIVKDSPNMKRAFERTFFQAVALFGYEVFF